MHPSVANYWNGKGGRSSFYFFLFYFICYFLVSSLLLMPPLNSYQCAISVQRKVVLNSFSHKNYQQMWVFISYAIYIGCFWTSFTFKCVTKELLKKKLRKKKSEIKRPCMHKNTARATHELLYLPEILWNFTGNT